MICLTAATGERTYGFCRRFLPACLAGVNAPRYPLTLCLLSVHRFFPHLFQARPALWRTRKVHCCHAYLLVVGCLLSGVSLLGSSLAECQASAYGSG